MQRLISIHIVILLFSSLAFAERVSDGANSAKDPYANTRIKQVQAQSNKKEFWTRPNFESVVLACIKGAKDSKLGILHNNDFIVITEAYDQKKNLIELTYRNRSNHTPTYRFMFSANKIFSNTTEENGYIRQNQLDHRSYDDISQMMKDHFSSLAYLIGRYDPALPKEDFEKIKESLCACEKIDSLDKLIQETREQLINNKNIHVVPKNDPSGKQPLTKENFKCAEKSLV